MELNNTPVLVTGGASGLGEATAIRLAAQGAKVAILDVQTEKAKAVAERIGGIAVYCDVTSDQSATQAIAEAREKHGVARVLVNCAGAGTGKRVVGKDGPMPLEDFTKVINLNLVGSFNMTRLAAADMIASDPLGEERGVILFTSSVAAFEGQIGQAAYSASKGGVASMTIQLAREFAQFGVRVMTIAPGIFLTPLMQTATPEVQASLSKATPFPSRLGRPEEFADLASHIIGNPFLNGEIIRIDGATRLGIR